MDDGNFAPKISLSSNLSETMLAKLPSMAMSAGLNGLGRVSIAQTDARYPAAQSVFR